MPAKMQTEREVSRSFRAGAKGQRTFVGFHTSNQATRSDCSGGDSRLLELFDVLPDLCLTGSTESGHLSLVFDEYESRHRFDLVLGSDVICLVHVHFEEDDVVLHLSGHLLQHRCDDFARTAPSGIEVDDDQPAPGRFQLRRQVRLLHHQTRYLRPAHKSKRLPYP